VALTPDQQATLQLLLERGQSYSDLATVLGIDEAEVRARARSALTELGGSDPDRNVGLTDYLLGQADPIGRADASRHLRADPSDHALATMLVEQLTDMYPDAQLPRLPGEPRPSRRRPKAEGEQRTLPGASLNPSQVRVILITGCAAILLLAAVLGIAGAFGGGDDGDSGSASAPTPATTSDSGEEISRVPLRAIDGGNASGEAVFGLATGDQPYVDVSIRGLDPAPQDRTYVVWLILQDSKGYPLAPITVSQDGTFQDRFPIPSAVLPVVARVHFVDVSIAPVKAIRQLVRDAIKNTSLVLDEPGDVVLRGRVPGGGAAAEGSGDSSSQGG
jgi:hypothetical protein